MFIENGIAVWQLGKDFGEKWLRAGAQLRKKVWVRFQPATASSASEIKQNYSKLQVERI